jgi:hypothetical protein
MSVRVWLKRRLNRSEIRRFPSTVLVLVGRALPHVSKEIVIVDDYSKDGTREWLKLNFPHGDRSGSTADLDTDGNLVFNQASGPSTVIMRPI